MYITDAIRFRGDVRVGEANYRAKVAELGRVPHFSTMFTGKSPETLEGIRQRVGDERVKHSIRIARFVETIDAAKKKLRRGR